jgi:L-amino acid N-acyltransferase YncA
VWRRDVPADAEAGQVSGKAGAPAGELDYVIRTARQDDVDAIAAFEVQIAIASFGADAITDADLHRRRVSAALGKPGETMLVAVPAAAGGEPAGWAWLSARTNSLTGARYGNFRSLAVADVPGRGSIGEMLMAEVLAAAERAGFTMLTGKVNAANLGMRALYRAFGFTAMHITMEKRIGDPPGRR